MAEVNIITPKKKGTDLRV